MKNIKRLLSVFLAVCLLLSGIPSTALAVEPEQQPYRGLVLRGLVKESPESPWTDVPTSDTDAFYQEVYFPHSYHPGESNVFLKDRWYVAAYIINEDDTIQGPLNPDSISVVSGNVTVQPVKAVDGPDSVTGANSDNFLCIAPTEAASGGETFTLQWGGPNNPTAEYGIKLPDDAFYSADARDKEHLLGGDMVCSADGPTEFYLIVDPSMATWMQNVEITQGADKANLTKVRDGVYKITVPVPTEEPFDFNVEISWDMQDPDHANNSWRRVRSMWMHPAPYTGLVIRELRYDEEYPVTDEQGNPVTDGEGNPVKGAWFMPEIDQNDPLAMTSQFPEAVFGEQRLITVHYFDGETLSPPLDVNNLTFTGNVAHPSLASLEPTYGDHAANYLALSPDPRAAAGPGDEFTISWTMPETSDTYTCTGTMRLPDLGFFQSQEPSLPDLITDRKGGFEYSPEKNTFYFIAHPSLLQPDEHTTRTISNVRLEQGARKADITKISDAVWKITLKEPPFEPFEFDMVVKCDISQTHDGQPDGGWPEERYVHCRPQTVAGEPIGVIGLGGKPYTVRRTEAGDIIYSTQEEGSPFETETELPQGVSLALPDENNNTYTLTLSNATLNGRIFFNAKNFNRGQIPATLPTLAINVEGTNTITSTNDTGMEVQYANLIIRGPGTLNINTMANALDPNPPEDAPQSRLPETFGIRVAGWEVADYTADFTITGNVTVNINTDVAANLRGYDHFGPCIAGMFEEGAINLTVSGNAKLNLNAHGSDKGVNGIRKFTVEGKAQVTADILHADHLVVSGDAADNHASVILNGQKVRYDDWLPTLDGKRIDITGYGQITVNEEADDRSHSPSVNLSTDIMDTVADDGLHLGGNGKLTINNAHLLIVNSNIEIAQTAVLDMNDCYGIGLRMESGSTATINGTVTIDNIDNEYDNYCIVLFEGSEMTLGSSSSVTASAVMNSSRSLPNSALYNAGGKVTVLGGTHSFKATGSSASFGFYSTLNGATDVQAGEITVEGSTMGLYSGSTLNYNYFTLDDSLHIVSQDTEDSGTELGFVHSTTSADSGRHDFYLYQGNNASGGTPVFVKKAKISSVSGTAPKAEHASVSLQTTSTPTAGARASFTAYINAPLNTEALVTVELPEGITIVGNSITKDTLPVQGTAIQKLPVMGPTIVRFTVNTTRAGEFPLVAKVFKSESDTEPLGQTTCTLNVTGFDISAPEVTGSLSSSLAVTGTAAPDQTVTLKKQGSDAAYTNATATANWRGSFRMYITLEDAGLTLGTADEVTFDTYLNGVKQDQQLTIRYQPALPHFDSDSIKLEISTTVHENVAVPQQGGGVTITRVNVKSTTEIPLTPVDDIQAQIHRYPFSPENSDVDLAVKTDPKLSEGPSDDPDYEPNEWDGPWEIERMDLIVDPGPGRPTQTLEMEPDPEDPNTWRPKKGKYTPPLDKNGYPKPPVRVWTKMKLKNKRTGKECDYVSPPRQLTPIIDPSGNVYEGNEDCPLEGVTATIYYLADEPSDKDATNVGVAYEGLLEGNPITTDVLGGFKWDVPEGWWQVRFTKDGYEEAHTQWMKVQPERYGLKVFMTASAPAELIETIERGADGKSFTVTFSKPVKNETVTADTLAVTAQGEAVEGKFYPINGDGATATKFKFVPDSGTLSPYAISIQAKNGIETYNSAAVAAMDEPYKETGRTDGPVTPIGPAGPSGGDPTDEPVVNPDGSTTVTETADDGTVVSTTTWQNGKKVVATLSPAGDKTVVVTSGKGETLADISIPADPGPGQKFEDVPSGAWYAKNVEQVTAYGLFNGTGGNSFSPNDPTTRAMLVKVLHNLSGKPAFGTDKNTFADVKDSDWFAKAVGWGYAAAVTSGISATEFKPNRNLTREEMVAMLHRYAKIIGADSDKKANLSKFPDGGKVSGYAKADMEWAVAAGLISGRADGGKEYIAPKDNAKRSEVAAVLVRFINYLKH